MTIKRSAGSGLLVLFLAFTIVACGGGGGGGGTTAIDYRVIVPESLF